jgi:hypothetical protein
MVDGGMGASIIAEIQRDGVAEEAALSWAKNNENKEDDVRC